MAKASPSSLGMAEAMARAMFMFLLPSYKTRPGDSRELHVNPCSPLNGHPAGSRAQTVTLASPGGPQGLHRSSCSSAFLRSHCCLDPLGQKLRTLTLNNVSEVRTRREASRVRVSVKSPFKGTYSARLKFVSPIFT